MIYICSEFELRNDTSVSKLLAYLDKVSQDVVIVPRRSDGPPKAGPAQTHVRSTGGTVGNVKANGQVVQMPSRLCCMPCGTLITDWSLNLTLKIKRWLCDHGLSIRSLKRDGDLGLRSPGSSEIRPMGVILKVTYSFSNSTRVEERQVVCYALTCTGYEAIGNAKHLLADYHADWLFFINRSGQWQVLQRQQKGWLP